MLSRTIEEARRELPEAFAHARYRVPASGQRPTASDAFASLTKFRFRSWAAEDRAEFTADDLTVDADSRWPADDDELDTSLQELGFEALAFYITFHRPLGDGRWGVFYQVPQMALFTRKIARDLRISDGAAWDLASGIVAAHEHFHFRFDVFALREELVTSKGLYLTYSDLCYA